MSIGKRISYIRKSKGITQSDLARSIHISPSFMNRIEKGTSLPNLDCICSIAEALQVTPQDILCDIFVYKNTSIADQIKSYAEQLSPDSLLLLLEILKSAVSNLKQL